PVHVGAENTGGREQAGKRLDEEPQGLGHRRGDSADGFAGILDWPAKSGNRPGACAIGNSRTKHAGPRWRREGRTRQKSPGTARGPGPKRVGLPMLPATPGSPYEPWALTRSGLAARRKRPGGRRCRLAGGGLPGRGLASRGLLGRGLLRRRFPGGRLAGRGLLGRRLLRRRLASGGLPGRGLLRRRLAGRGLLGRGLLGRRLACRGLVGGGLLGRGLVGRGRRGARRRR